MGIFQSFFRKFFKREHFFTYKDGTVVKIRNKTKTKPELYGTLYSPEKPSSTGVIICHGLSLVRKVFEPMALTIKNSGFNVLTFTFRGHGWKRKGKLTLETALEDVKDAVEYMKTKHDNIVLVGHSLGALMSLKASLCKNVKNNISSVVLIGCPTTLAAAKVQTAAIFALSKIMASVDVSEVMKQLEDFDSMKDIKKVNIPTLMIYGEFDEVLAIFLKRPRTLKKKINVLNPKNVTCEIIEGMFHVPIKKKCYQMVADWIKKYSK